MSQFGKNKRNLIKGKCAANFQDFLTNSNIIRPSVFDKFYPEKVFSSIFKECDLKLVSEFALNKSIIVTKPDKG